MTVVATSLTATLSALAPNHVLWLAPAGDSATASVPIMARQLQAALAATPLEPWRGKRVALGSMPILELLATLVLLDGVAAAILMLPSEEDEPARAARLTQAGMDCVLTGDGLGLTRRLADAATGTPAPAQAATHPPIPTTWMMPTSGTTGSPKLISHSLASLTKSMAQPRPGKAFTWGCLYSVRRFAGLQVFLQAWLARTPLILAEEGAPLAQTLARLLAANCNALSATPSMWRKLAMMQGFAALPLQQITLGGEIVDQAVLDMLAHSFPAARITHIYASTEAGVGFAVKDGRAGFPLALLQGAGSNPAMRIDADNHLCFADVLLADVAGADGWLDSGDVVQVVGERVLFLGRANGSINVGGNKVMPEEVETVIKQLPQIAFVQVRARKSGMMGSLVEAAVCLAPGHVFDAAFKKQLTSHCRTRLDAFKVPAFIVELSDIELTASGKLSRVAKETPT